MHMREESSFSFLFTTNWSLWVELASCLSPVARK